MELLWRTQCNRLLCRRGPQEPPFSAEVGASLFDQTCDFDLVDPANGEVVEKYRRRYTRFEQKSAWHLTGHVIEGETLVEILFRVQVPEYHNGQEREAIEHATLLTGLAPQTGRSWITPEGQHLLEGAPQTTTYGTSPPCDLLDGLYDYTLLDPVAGVVIQRFHPSDVLIGHGDDEVLTRHRMEEDALVEYVFDYYEDSCWGVGHVRGHKRNVRLTGLVALPAGAV